MTRGWTGQTSSPVTDTLITDVTTLPDQNGSGGAAASMAASNGLLAQLQQLISNAAAAPITREFAVRATELAALAAEKAGPAARSLAS